MPSYDYKCTNEECVYHEFTLIKQHSIAECEEEHFCPMCETKQIKSSLQRIIGDVSISIPGTTKPDKIRIKA